MSEEQTDHVIDEQPERLRGEGEAHREEPSGREILLLSLGSLGVVFGDIGTSPLYALRWCFLGHNPIEPTPANVLGVLSLIFWSLILVISVKYLLYVMRAENSGEGGILALMALLSPWGPGSHRNRWVVIALGVFGAALLYGDGVITPAISVLSAVEGLTVATTSMNHLIVPITMVILILLFAFQRRGTAGIGAVFGPVMLVWFLTIAILGIAALVHRPHVLVAVSPIHGYLFFLHHHWEGFLVLGSVFLVVTGGEALYADMGHFSLRTIRVAWFGLVLPSLLLNYFGQGALLLTNPEEVFHPFYHLAPDWALYPLVILATMATVIASQAVISGVYSLSRQAAFLGLLPRQRIVQTSSTQIGQIYIPSINWMLMIATVGIVLAMRDSSGLASAYGVAVSTTMVITTLLAYLVAREKWHWSLPAALAVTVAFLSVDLAFFSANMVRIVHGGWIPLLLGGAVFGAMYTWKRGRRLVRERLTISMVPLDSFVKSIGVDSPVRVPGTAVFMSASPHGTPPMLLHHLKFNKVLHERVILVTVVIDDVPRVVPLQRLKIQDWDQGISQVLIHFGFMEDPDVPRALEGAQARGLLDIDHENVVYFVGGQTIIPTPVHTGMSMWRKRLYALMVRNAAQSIAFYKLPPDLVIEIGMEIEI
jgi:KUP system potassium uptake protein